MVRDKRDCRREDWLAAFLAGDADAVGEVERTAATVVCHRFFGFDRDERRDLIQQTVVQLLVICRRDGFQLRGRIDALVRRVARARCIDRLRLRRETVELESRCEDTNRTPCDEKLVEAERREQLRAVIASLNPSDRQLLHWRLADELSIAEIARRQGCKPVTVRVKLHQCTVKLRDRLAKLGLLE